MKTLLHRLAHLGLTTWCVLALLFLLLPVLIVVPMSFSGASTLRFPPEGFSLRWYAQIFGDERWLAALNTSLGLAVIASTSALLLGSIAAYGLARRRVPGHAIVQSNFMAPLIVPAVIFAVALYFTLAWAGMLGSLLGLWFGHMLLGVPYIVLILNVAIRNVDVRIEQVAFTLGASWFTMFFRILLPNLAPSLAAAWIFAFVTSFDEVVITAFISGHYETVPKRMFNELTLQINPAITAIATLLICMGLLLMGAAAALMHRARKRPGGAERPHKVRNRYTGLSS